MQVSGAGPGEWQEETISLSREIDEDEEEEGEEEDGEEEEEAAPVAPAASDQVHAVTKVEAQFQRRCCKWLFNLRKQ